MGQNPCFGWSNEAHDRPESLVLKNQPDGFCPSFYCGELTPFVVLTYVSQDCPFTISRWIANAIVTELIVPGVDVVLRVTQDITSFVAVTFSQ